jgi:hypothetical protein
MTHARPSIHHTKSGKNRCEFPVRFGKGIEQPPSPNEGLRAQVRADALIAEHQEALIIVATAVYEARRLTDERLAAVLVSAGFTLPRPTA